MVFSPPFHCLLCFYSESSADTVTQINPEYFIKHIITTVPFRLDTKAFPIWKISRNEQNK